MEVKNTPVTYIPKNIAAAESIKPQLQEQQSHQEGKIERVEPAVTKDALRNKVEGLNDFLEPTDTALKFQLHEELNEYYVQIVNPMTNEVIKEIPNKKFLDMYASMTEMIGIVVDEKS